MTSLQKLSSLSVNFGANAKKYVEPLQKTVKMGGSSEGERVSHFKLSGGQKKNDGTYEPRFVELVYPEKTTPTIKLDADAFKPIRTQVLNVKGGFQLTCMDNPFNGQSNRIKWITYGEQLESFIKGMNSFFEVYPEILTFAKEILNQNPTKREVQTDEQGNTVEVEVPDLDGEKKPLYLHTYSQLRYIVRKIDEDLKQNGIDEPLWDNFCKFERSFKIEVDANQTKSDSNIYAYFEEHNDIVVNTMNKMAKNSEICEKFYVIGGKTPVVPDMQFFPFDVNYPYDNFKTKQTMNVFDSEPGVSGRTTASRLKVAEPTPRLRFTFLDAVPEYKVEVNGEEFRLDTYASKDSQPLWNFLIQNLRKNKNFTDEEFFEYIYSEMCKKVKNVIVEEFLRPQVLIALIQDDLDKNPLKLEIGLNKNPKYYSFTFKEIKE